MQLTKATQLIFFLTLTIFSNVLFSQGTVSTQATENNSETNTGVIQEETNSEVNVQSSETSDEELVDEKEVEEEKSRSTLSLLDRYDQDPGFALFPRTKYFSIRNVLTSTFSYDSNARFRGVRDEDSFLVRTTIASSLKYEKGRINTEFNSRYSYTYFSEVDQDLSTRFDVSGRLNYRYRFFTLSVDTSVRRDIDDDNPERSVDNLSYLYQYNLSLRTAYQGRWSFSLNHSFRREDFRDFQGDVQEYTFGATANYAIFRDLFIFVSYNASFFDFLEAFRIPGGPFLQEDSLGHSYSGGFSWTPYRVLSLSLTGGFTQRDETNSFIFNASASWTITKKATLSLEAGQALLTSLRSDFRESLFTSLSFDYLITEQLRFSSRIRWTRSESTSNALFQERELEEFGYNLRLNYRYYQGLDLFIFHQANFRDDNNVEEDQYIFGSGISIIF